MGVVECTVQQRKLAFSSWKAFIRPGEGTGLLTSKKLLVKHTRHYTSLFRDSAVLGEKVVI
jgi:hypothetical protein